MILETWAFFIDNKICQKQLPTARARVHSDRWRFSATIFRSSTPARRVNAGEKAQWRGLEQRDSTENNKMADMRSREARFSMPMHLKHDSKATVSELSECLGDFLTSEREWYHSIRLDELNNFYVENFCRQIDCSEKNR